MTDQISYHGAVDLEELEMKRAQTREFIDQVNYDELDPGVRNLVRWLRSRGFFTVDSGDGSKVGEQDGARPEAHVVMLVPPEAISHYADHLRRLLFQEHEVLVTPLAPEPGGIHVAATYDPCDKQAILDLSGVSDSMLKEFEELPPMPKPEILDRAGNKIA